MTGGHRSSGRAGCLGYVWNERECWISGGASEEKDVSFPRPGARMLMLWILLTEPRSTEMRGEQTDPAGQVPPVKPARLQTATLRPGGQRAAAGPPPARPSAVRRATLSVCGSALCEVTTSGPHLPTPYMPAPHGHTQPFTPTPRGRVCPHGTSQPPISVSCGLHHG